jgi:hypothetical protein
VEAARAGPPHARRHLATAGTSASRATTSRCRGRGRAAGC